jgi:hypothetical protein
MNNLTNDLLSQPLRHLTNEQFEALLLAPSTNHPHLNICERCTGQLAALRSALGDLRVTSVAAAEIHYRAAERAQRSQQRSRFQPRLTWAFTAVAGMLFIGLPFAAKFHPFKAPAQGPVITATTKASAESGPSVSNLSDDQLLSSIQSDLSASVPDPLLPLDSTSTSTTASK